MKDIIKAGLVFCVFLLMVLFPSVLSAQSGMGREGYDGEGKAIVGILPFTGEEEPAAVLNRAAIDAVANLGNYSPRLVGIEAVEAAEVRVPTDMPPVKELVPGMRFALTGGVYPGNFPEEFYLQLWLWDMANSSMIYTDDLIYEHIEEGLASLPGLVEWLFSHIVVISPESEVPAEPVPIEEKRLTVGVRSGVSLRWYIDPDELVPGAQALNFEGGFFASVFLNTLFSLQGEVNFTFDNLVYRGIDNIGEGDDYVPELVNEKYTSYSLMFPLILKANFRPGNFRLAPFAGIYAFMPLGEAEFRKNPGSEEEGTFSWSPSVPLGYTAGIEISVKVGPGVLLGDIRYAGDFTEISIKDAENTAYRRGGVSFTIGYGYSFIDMKRR
jgi:hypothetical protein